MVKKGQEIKYVEKYRSLKMQGAHQYSVLYYLYNSRELKRYTGNKTLRREDITTSFLDKHSTEGIQVIRNHNRSIKNSDLIKGKPVFKMTGVCFSELISALSKYGIEKNIEVDSMAYNLDFDKRKPIALTKEAEMRWIHNCMKVGFLPKGTNIKETVYKRLFILNPCFYNRSLLYVYLCSIRNIVEEPCVPLLCLDIMEELGYEFEVAFAIAEELMRVNTGHSFLSLNRNNQGSVLSSRVRGVYNAIKTRIYIKNQLDIIKDKKNTIGAIRKNSPDLSMDRRFDVYKNVDSVKPITKGVSIEKVQETFSLDKAKSKEVNKTFKELRRVNRV